jgi:FRG domain
MAIGVRAAASLQELVATVLEIRKGLSDDAFLWFRGLDCSLHGLLPKIMREGKTEEQIFEREKRLLTRFRQRGMAYWPAGYPQSDWEHLFAMQHYGLPTRLLDWSENLFVAAYFALNPTHPVHDCGQTCTPNIWCIDPIRWNRAMCWRLCKVASIWRSYSAM